MIKNVNLSPSSFIYTNGNSKNPDFLTQGEGEEQWVCTVLQFVNSSQMTGNLIAVDLQVNVG